MRFCPTTGVPRTAASFFYDGDNPLRTEAITDPYRRGMLLTARATSHAERALAG
jgi:hypothetical protein